MRHNKIRNSFNMSVLSFGIFLFLLYSGEYCQAGCPYKFIPHGNSCYLIVNKVLANWYEAKTFCTTVGGDLAVIRSQDEENFIEAQLKALHGNVTGAPENYWLDGTDILQEGEFRWMSREGNSELIQGYTNWAPGQPDNAGTREHCLEIRYTFSVHWNDYVCEQAQNFICKSTNDWEAGTGIIGK